LNIGKAGKLNEQTVSQIWSRENQKVPESSEDFFQTSNKAISQEDFVWNLALFCSLCTNQGKVANRQKVPPPPRKRQIYRVTLILGVLTTDSST